MNIKNFIYAVATINAWVLVWVLFVELPEARINADCVKATLELKL